MNIKVFFISTLLLISFSGLIIAETSKDDLYINQLNYHRNKLELLVKTRTISETSNYSSTDWTSTTYTLEAYSQTYGSAATSSGSRAETREITVWKVIKGGVRQLSDAEFLDIVGKHGEAENIRKQEDSANKYRLGGMATSLAGLGYMLLASGQSNNSTAITTGGVVTAIGFLISAFNQSPWHYITSDYAQELMDDYNINLKKKLGLPINFN